MKKIAILGSTGSIGVQALEAMDTLGGFCVTALSANSNTKLLAEQIRKYRPKIAAIANIDLYKELSLLTSDLDVKILAGEEGLISVAEYAENDMVLSAIVGIAGMLPTIAAIDAGHDVALANKESLVTAGSIVMQRAAKKEVKIIPVDSEHSAIFQCLQGAEPKEIKKLVLTASGGPFFGKSIGELCEITPKDALRHPNWSMGQKITIDSATLMNKGLEVIEAQWLFNMDCDDIEVVIHRQSIIHSMVRFTDNSVLAQLGLPDMKLPIIYALSYPNRCKWQGEGVDFFELPPLTFHRADYDTFKCLELAIVASKAGGTMPTILNGANEAAVELFLRGEIPFLAIPELINQAMEGHNNIINPEIEDILWADEWAREMVRNISKNY